MVRLKWFRLWAVLLFAPALLFAAAGASAEEQPLSPAYPVPEYVEHLLQVASEEVGYTEDHGRTKYGEWAGDPAAQWCAEFQCWCVNEVDRRWGTSLLRNVYPYYTSSNTGKNWFIRAGRYAVRKGKVEGWGYEWLKGRKQVMQSGDYIPQPGDWVFFNWSGGSDTDHVALVEFCTRDTGTGSILVHVIEGNKPSAVARASYGLNDRAILGYGTVRDVAEITMRFGNQGEKVRQLQEKLAYLGLLDASLVNGRFGDTTLEAIRAFQAARNLHPTGVATMQTQLLLTGEFTARYEKDPDIWTVVDTDE